MTTGRTRSQEFTSLLTCGERNDDSPRYPGQLKVFFQRLLSPICQLFGVLQDQLHVLGVLIYVQCLVFVEWLKSPSPLFMILKIGRYK